MFLARSTRGRGQGTSPSGRRARRLQVPPFFSTAWGVPSHSCQFLGDSAFGLCIGGTRGRKGMQHSEGETQGWLDGCWHSPEPAGTHSTSCNIGKFQNKISCTKSQDCDSAETWLYNWICQKPVTLNVQLPRRRAAPRHAPWPVLALPLSLPLGRQPGMPCPDVPIAPTHCRNIPNRCCPARCWEWLRQERCSSHPFRTPTPRRSTCQELFPPIWSSGLGTPGLLSHPGAAGCSCGFLYEEAGVFCTQGLWAVLSPSAWMVLPVHHTSLPHAPPSCFSCSHGYFDGCFFVR